MDSTAFCHAHVPNMGQCICTRPGGHAGDHRCNVGDVDLRRSDPQAWARDVSDDWKHWDNRAQ